MFPEVWRDLGVDDRVVLAGEDGGMELLGTATAVTQVAE